MRKHNTLWEYEKYSPEILFQLGCARQFGQFFLLRYMENEQLQKNKNDLFLQQSKFEVAKKIDGTADPSNLSRTSISGCTQA